MFVLLSKGTAASAERKRANLVQKADRQARPAALLTHLSHHSRCCMWFCRILEFRGKVSSSMPEYFQTAVDVLFVMTLISLEIAYK